MHNPLRFHRWRPRAKPSGDVIPMASTFRGVVDDLSVLVAMMLGRDMVQAPADRRPDVRGHAPGPVSRLPAPRQIPGSDF